MSEHEYVYLPGDLRTEDELRTVLEHCRAGRVVDLWACACRTYAQAPNAAPPACAVCEERVRLAPRREGARAAVRLVASVRESVPVPPPAASGKG